MGSDNTKRNNTEIKEGKDAKASVHPGSTTQGGSNYGQGSYQLDDKSGKQGSEKNDGANYDNEKGINPDAIRGEDNDVVDTADVSE